jgi:hypothetical protein
VLLLAGDLAVALLRKAGHGCKGHVAALTPLYLHKGTQERHG